MDLIPRFFKVPQQSFFLFGPRGTGKSTWLQNQFSDALYIDLLATDVLRDLTAYPEKLINVINGYPEKNIVIIDEIQKAPQLLSIVHKIIEEQRNKTFILTGSSARKLNKTGVDLLAGRALKKNMHPFMAAELGKQFNLMKALEYGMVPIVTDSADSAEVIKTYITIYLEEEVKREGLVRNIGDFSRFLEAASLTHGQMLNVTNVAHDCQVKRKTVEGFFSIVQDLLIGFKIPVFTRRAQRALVAHPKFYFFDCGVFRAIRPKGPLDSSQEIAGAALEGLVVQHLRAWIDYSNRDAALYFWRTRAGSEVDFILYGESLFVAVEVKASPRIKAQHLRGLKAFTKDYPQCRGLLLYLGNERLVIDGIRCVPCSEFLTALVPGTEFPFA